MARSEARKVPRSPPQTITAKYTPEIGAAAQAYIDSFPYAHKLPAQFRWEDLWNAMHSAAAAGPHNSNLSYGAESGTCDTQDPTERDATIHVTASLAAAISLLERAPAAHKAAPSQRMFLQMLEDYKLALAHARHVLGGNPETRALPPYRDLTRWRRDSQLLSAIESECWDVVFTSSPNGDAGDHSIGIEVIQHHMGRPTRRIVGENHNEDLRAALEQAMGATGNPPARPEHNMSEQDADVDLLLGQTVSAYLQEHKDSDWCDARDVDLFLAATVAPVLNALRANRDAHDARAERWRKVAIHDGKGSPT